eukprot:CAMPEP_0194223998 /NCGR_PEP_ID=MMETSP0156-20130528/36455_1 /TAXON_ID=33649 /ORGANISM="Thalassionema nitzschioides, Strain L26-B" /LENGTH=294 /DNA_ID=CAMNT_0038955369 /DNA_START=112 /DNA_END=993 /DNA_ORIENTATION=-
MNNVVENIMCNASSPPTKRRRYGGITVTFPMKLYSMLEETSKATGDERIITWSEGGDYFIIYNPEKFTQTLMLKYFRTKKFSSFQRQLNSYGFKRKNLYAAHEDVHFYTHDIFHRDEPKRLKQIERKKAGKKRRIALPLEAPSNTTSKQQQQTYYSTVPEPAALVQPTTSGNFRALGHDQILPQMATNLPNMAQVQPVMLQQYNPAACYGSISGGEVITGSILSNLNHPYFPVGTMCMIRSMDHKVPKPRRDIILDGAHGENIPRRPMDFPSYSLSDWDVEKEALQVDACVSSS